jgi:photosystem II stability/assembly factor-like uncharacterized protein
MTTSIRLLLLFAALLGLHSPSRAGEWFWQYPLPQGNALWKVHFYDEWYGYAVGDWGTIMFSNDHGLTWELQYEAVTDNLRDIAVVDPLTAWIVGDNGTILHTTNGGAQWGEQSSTTLAGLNAVSFLDASRGWACGDQRTVRATTNGGQTWTAQTLPGMGGGVSANDVVFLNPLEGWIVGGSNGGTGYIWRTTDGGAVWTQHASAAGVLQTIAFLNSSVGLIGGTSGTLLRTVNGGATWTPVASGTIRGLNDIFIGGSTDLRIAGDNGTLLHSTDAGASWTVTTLPTFVNVHGVGRGGQVTVAVGEGGLLAHAIPPAGWILDNPGTHKSVNWVTFADPFHGIAAGQDGTILRTYDGGTHWTPVVNGVTGDSFYGATMAGPDKAWVVGDLGVLLHSSNSGVSWVQQTTGTLNSLLSVSFVTPSLGWAVGDAGTLLKTTNGGAVWFPLPTGTLEVLYSVTFKDALNGWITGDNGLIRRSTDGGASWAPQAGPTAAALFSATFLDLSIGYCAGGNGTILKTTDGGAVWNALPSGFTGNLYIAAPSSPAVARAIGDSGLVLLTTDGGATWTREFPKMGYDVFGLHVLNDTTAWLGGDSSAVLRTGGTPFSAVTVSVGEGWNMVALPVSRGGGTDSVQQIFPSALNGQAYGFSPATGYLPSRTMQAVRGYWVKFSAPEDVLIIGTPLSTGIADVEQGWNVVGGLSAPVDVSTITSVPPGIRVSDWFGYSGTYAPVTVLQPGEAYWVKTGAPGLFLLSTAGPSPQTPVFRPAAAPAAASGPQASGLISPKFRNVRRR